MNNIKRALSALSAAAAAAIVGIAVSAPAEANTIRFEQRHGHTDRTSQSHFNVTGTSTNYESYHNRGWVQESGHVNGLDIDKKLDFTEFGSQTDIEKREGVVKTQQTDWYHFDSIELNNWGL